MTKTPPTDFAGLMAHWPTLAELAADIGSPIGTVLAWSSRGSIPRARWPDILIAAKGRGYKITQARLEAAAKQPPVQSVRVKAKKKSRAPGPAAAASRPG
jgi:hypothetical protein